MGLTCKAAAPAPPASKEMARPHAPEPPTPKEMKVDSSAAGSGSHPSSVSSGVVEASSAAGSGNHPSSASSGVVEAEGRGSLAYTEGVGGQYTCAECGKRALRSGFLIDATDLEGNLRVERDWEGRLHGR